MELLEILKQTRDVLGNFASDESPKGYEAISAYTNLDTAIEQLENAEPFGDMQTQIEELRTELAATQLQLKEAREALMVFEGWKQDQIDYLCNHLNLYDGLIHGDKSIRVAICKINTIYGNATKFLSRPADTTALNRYVAEELRRMADEVRKHITSAGLAHAMLERADELESTK